MERLLHEFFTGNAYRDSLKIAVTDGKNSITYKQLDEASNRLANMLICLGVKKGDKVALFTKKSIESIVAIISILKSGAAFLPVNTNMPIESISYIINDCNVKVLFSDKNSQKILEYSKNIDCLDTIILSENLENAPNNNNYQLINLKSELHKFGNYQPTINNISNDLAYIIYTSGSTGVPKGVMISHRGIVFVVNYRRKFLNFDESVKLISVAPLYFDPVLNEIFCTLSVGGVIYLIDNTYNQVADKSISFLHLFLNIIQSERITIFFCVPSLLNLLSSNLQELTKYDLSSLKYITFGAGSCPVKTIQNLQRILPQVNFVHGYGLTETSVTACSYRITDPFVEKYESFPLGDPIPDTEFYVVDENMLPVSAGEVGEIVIRGPHLMNGYWNNTAETDKVMILNPFCTAQNEKVLLSGDLVRVEENGELIFVGRKDDQIKTAGYRVELGEIEMKIGNFEGVKEVGVIAVADDDIGNIIKCFVSLKKGYLLQDLIDYCLNNLTLYTIPHCWVVMDEIPKNQNGKIEKKLLKTLA